MKLSFTPSFIKIGIKWRFVEGIKIFGKKLKTAVSFYRKGFLQKKNSPENTPIVTLHVVKIFARNL